MSSTIAFPICSLVFAILLVVVYFSKKKLDTIENRIYALLIVTNFIGIILELLCQSVWLLPSNLIILSNIILKLYLVYLVVWISIFTVYVFVISEKRREIPSFDVMQYYKKVKKIFIIVSSTMVVILICLPIHLFNENALIYSYGASVDSVYVYSFICIGLWVIRLIKNFGSIKQKKYVPVFMFGGLGAVVACIQAMNPAIVLMTSMETFITFLMYFTIENPDLKLINELNIAKDQAERANSAKTDFLSNMSHEIRTPLNAIVGFSQSLMEQDIPDKVKGDVKDIVMASDNLLDIVNGILDISKIEANKLEIKNNEYRPSDIFEELVNLTRGRLGEKPLDFRISIDKNLPSVLYGDHSRLKQIVLNILTNAVKYTKEGFVELRVDTIVQGDMCRLIISVEDSGIGIQQDKIDKLFDKFERIGVEDEISIEGTGLGLAITKKLVELMNGKIVAQSLYGKGSKFTVAIDQKIVATPTTIEIKKQDNDEIVECPGKTVLVVDDNKVNLKVASRLLANYKVTIIEANSGIECLDRINNGEKYDLIFMDDMMPRLSGVETFHKLKENAEFNTPVVALTANAISGMREKYLEEGFDDYMPKPIQRLELNRVIKKFLSKN